MDAGQLARAEPGEAAGSGQQGQPLVAGAAVSAYLADERDRGRIAADADIDSLALSLAGGGHLLFSDREPGPPGTATVKRFVATVLADVLRRRPR